MTDIGNGFVMDDYVMEKWVAPRTLLYVDTCLRTGSRTRELADAFLNAYRKAHPQDTVDVVRLAEADIHCIRGEELERREALKSEGKIDAPEFAEARRFAAADGIVVAAPMWELSFPAILKAYIETVSVPGITFRYGEGDTGCIGCCKASRLLYLTTRGGLYTGAASGLELGEKEMKALSVLRHPGLRLPLCRGDGPSPAGRGRGADGAGKERGGADGKGMVSGWIL